MPVGWMVGWMGEWLTGWLAGSIKNITNLTPNQSLS